MSTYVRDMASVFDGFRLDNAHNTQLHVAKYLINQARNANPNLYVIAELFCDSKDSEIRYVQDLGLNHLMRELQFVSHIK